MKLIINTYTDECEGVKHCFLKRKTMLSLKENIAFTLSVSKPCLAIVNTYFSFLNIYFGTLKCLFRFPLAETGCSRCCSKSWIMV